jgi:hypothetical protein
MNRWDKQHVAGWAKTNRTKGTMCVSEGRAQSDPRMRPDGRIREVLLGITAQVRINGYYKLMMLIRCELKHVMCRVRN